MNNITDLQSIQNFINDSNETNSNTDKLNILKKYSSNEAVCMALNYTYNTFKKYGITSANCKKNLDLSFNNYDNLFYMLDDLNDRNITGHDAIRVVNGFVEANKSYEDLIFSIIDRNLKTRSTTSMINKVIPGLIPTFDVALANSYDEKTKKKVNWKDGWYISRKLDGVRCICMIDSNGEPTFYSRAGNEFKTLDSLKPSIIKLGLSNMVLDGECCMTDAHGNEDFQSIIKEIKRKDHTIETPKYFIFDMLTLKEFTDKESTTILGDRLSSANNTIDNDMFIEVLPQILGDDEVLESYMETSKNEGWEGLMLRKNDTYKGKRSADILKVKSFHDAEYVVLGVKNALQRVIVEGYEVTEMMLKNVIIEHKGNKVDVGSGFSHDQRRRYFTNPEEIIGKTINVQYFETTKNMQGTESLRFPTFKAIYETKRNF